MLHVREGLPTTPALVTSLSGTAAVLATALLNDKLFVTRYGVAQVSVYSNHCPLSRTPVWVQSCMVWQLVLSTIICMLQIIIIVECTESILLAPSAPFGGVLPIQLHYRLPVKTPFLCRATHYTSRNSLQVDRLSEA